MLLPPISLSTILLISLKAPDIKWFSDKIPNKTHNIDYFRQFISKQTDIKSIFVKTDMICVKIEVFKAPFEIQ